MFPKKDSDTNNSPPSSSISTNRKNGKLNSNNKPQPNFNNKIPKTGQQSFSNQESNNNNNLPEKIKQENPVVSNNDNSTSSLSSSPSTSRAILSKNLVNKKQTNCDDNQETNNNINSSNEHSTLSSKIGSLLPNSTNNIINNKKIINAIKLELSRQSSSSSSASSVIQQRNSLVNNNLSCQDKSTNTNDNPNPSLSSSSDSSKDYLWNLFEYNISQSNDISSGNVSLTESTLPVNHSFSLDSSSNNVTFGSTWKFHSTDNGTDERAILPNNFNTPFLKQYLLANSDINFLKNSAHVSNMELKNNRMDLLNNRNMSSNCNMINSLTFNSPSSNICRDGHHFHAHINHLNHIKQVSSLIERRQLIQNNQFDLKNANNSNSNDENNFEISSVQATKIISNHCNSETNNTNANSNSSAAITTLTSSSSGLPVSALTVMESPKLSTNRSHNWQAYKLTLKDRMKTIFNRDILADVYFNVGKKNQTRFAAHKFVLSIGSAVFDAMFNGLLAKTADSENKKNGSDNSITEIELPDVEPEAFRSLLSFLYLDEIEIDSETVMAILYAAKKYEVLALEATCVDYLKANLNPENAFMLLTQARLFDESTLADLCLDAIDKHTLNALQSDYFLDIDLETLKMVLGRDTLRVREALLFNAVLKWIESECKRRQLEVNAENKRQVLGDALYLLRFPLMTIEEFALYAAQSGLLTDKQVVNLFLYYTVESKSSVPFSFEPRCCITGEEYSVNRFQRTERRWGYSGTSDRIRFLTDRTIFVIGFGLYGSIQGQSEYEAIIEIIHTGSGKVLASNTITFTSDGSDSTFKVMFQHPVEISQNTNYTACATLKGADSYYGTNGCRTLTVNLGKGHNKDSVNFQFSYAAGCNNGTSVEDGQIPEIIFYV